jgi:hypothetical protein
MQKERVRGMAGYHIIHRATKTSGYVAAGAVLILPSNCDCKSDSSTTANNGVFPEFFLGFYKSGYGLDIGIIYRGQGSGSKTFRLFCNGLANTVNNTNHYNEITTTLSKGNTVTLSAYLSGNNIVLAATKSGGSTFTLTTPLTSGAKSAFAAGATINRELTCASNVSPYITSAAYFSDTTWVDTTLTKTSGGYENMLDTNVNTNFKQFADDGVTMDGNRYGYVNLGIVNGFLKELGSCDFR